MNKYNVHQIAKTLDKIFTAGFTNEKKILNIQLEDLQNIPDLSAGEVNIIIKLKKAIKNKNLIAFLEESQIEKGEIKNENISI